MSAFARTRVLGLLAKAGLVALLIACGDDDSSHGDAGTKMDASARDDGGPTKIPRRDAAVSATDPIPSCDRADPNSCASGQTCDLVIRRAPTDMQFTVYPGCVGAHPERGLGDPCDATLTDGTPYTAPGLTDEVYLDPCGPGLICAPDRKVRGTSTCQPLCTSGEIGDSPIECQSNTALCISTSSGYVSFCRESERCDVAKQTGCNSGEGCYLLPTNDAQALLAVCWQKPDAPIADGKTCTDFYDCNPGSLCLGPVRIPPTRWMDTDLVCRPACSATAID
ncbi:MAG TPA: hypothetical protein VGI70_04985, partial [Polyangiales bacterium]